MFYVYILQSADSQTYIGYTSDLRRRFAEHNSGASKHTKNKKWKLVYYEAYVSKKDATKREARLKQYANSLSHLKKRIENSLSHKSVG